MGETYEQLEYTPYGELWVERVPVTEATPFRFTGKERDGETGLYYFGARYLNPQTSMWLSADPAMGEYIPQAPINDDAKKYNKNLPGMGGVFNYVNLHAYHYAGNNPVKLTDPDGAKSGIVMDYNGVYGFGHAGIFVELDNGGFAFFEVTDLPEYAIVGIWIQIDKGRKFGDVLSNTPLKIPTTGSADSLGKYKNGGVLRRDFENYGALEDYLKQSGYDIMITKNTTAIQDNIILESAIKLGSEFTGYNLLGNQCGTFAGEVLSTPGSGWKFENHASIIPNNIGAIFYKSNQDSYLNFLNPKYKNGFLLDVGELNMMDIK